MADWVTTYLKANGFPVTPQNRQFLTSWQKWEGGATNNNAANNYLNTTLNVPGASSINSVGVKAYPDLMTGAKAFGQTLQGNPNYQGLLQGFRSGNPYTKASVAGLSTWLSGSPNSQHGLDYANKVLGTRSKVLASGAQGAAGAPGPVTGPGGGDVREALLSSVMGSLGSYASGGDQKQNPYTSLATLLGTLRAARMQAGGGSTQQAPSDGAAVPGGIGAPSPTPSHGLVGIPGTGYQMNGAYLPMAENLMRQFGVHVSSGYRSPQHNAEVGGAPHSDHMSGNAIDFVGTPQQMHSLYTWAQGRFPYVEPWSQSQNHVHISFAR